jgi:DNA recombination protein RmuC
VSVPEPAFLIPLALAALFGMAALVFFVQARTRAVSEAVARDRAAELQRLVESLRERLGVAEREGAAAEARAAHLQPLQARLDAAEAKVRGWQAEIAARDSAFKVERETFDQRLADLTRLRGEMEKDFKNLANAALGESRDTFLALAGEVFGKHRAETNAEIEARRKAVEELVRPIGENLKQTREKLEQIEKERADSFGQIRQQLTSVGHEAARLTQALRANPGTRGRWGEESLRNALELAGLSAHCDFETQATFAAIDVSVRPDCVIRLPGRRSIVVDAKAPISAYLEGVEATDEATRAACMKRHADSLRQHMLSLARKEYAQTVSAHLSARPDFVAMYVPGENFFAAAIERNGALFEEAIGRGVFIVTPTTLIALAKAIALGWRQEAIAENARDVARLGRELYARIVTMGEHVAKLGRSLEAGVKSYNSFVGSIEASVLPQARKFRELHVADDVRMIDQLRLVETDVREPASGRDLLFDDPPLALSAAE